MAKPPFLVLRAAGTNCEIETAWALERSGADPRTVHVGRLLEKPDLLKEARGLVIPGGFSYGDDIAAGRILANQLKHHLAPALAEFVERGGLVLGICNGFQVLVKTGLLPGRYLPRFVQEVTLGWNDSNHYECRWVHLECLPSRCLFLPPEGTVLRIPVAHAEGKLLPGKQGDEKALVREGLAPLRYVTPSGGSPAPFPWNPNGSAGGIAALTDPSGRILGMMPHPERAMLPWHVPGGDPPQGGEIFRRMVALAAG